MKIKTLTVKELRAKKTGEVDKYIAELQQSFGELNHQISINKETTTHQLSLVKKAIARAHTVQTEAQGLKEK